MIVIACPSCHCRLRLPDSLLGESVRCPRCDQDFPAAAALEVREPSRVTPARAEESRPARPASAAGLPGARAGVDTITWDEEDLPEDVPCPYCEERVAAGSRRCRFCGGTLEVDTTSRRVRRDAEPHRGGLIQTLGIASVILGSLSFAFCGLTAPLGLPLGVAAWVMANRDLPRLRAGEMDPEGMAATLTGRQCGILGVVFSLLCGLGFGALLGMSILN